MVRRLMAWCVPDRAMRLRHVNLHIHVELTEDNEVVWWADSPQAPGYSAAAPSLHELRESMRSMLGANVTTSERLVDAYGVPQWAEVITVQNDRT